MVESNFEVDLDDLRRAHDALGRVMAVNEQVVDALPAAGSPGGATVAGARQAVEAHGALVGRLAGRQRRGVEAIAETRRRLKDIESAYRAADRW